MQAINFGQVTLKDPKKFERKLALSEYLQVQATVADLNEQTSIQTLDKMGTDIFIEYTESLPANIRVTAHGSSTIGKGPQVGAAYAIDTESEEHPVLENIKTNVKSLMSQLAEILSS